MHRRARHLTGRAAGASFHYDVRFLNSTDGTGIATVKDLAGSNDMTQSTSGSRALYKTNVLGGNAVIRFDGTDDFYSLTTGVPISGEYLAASLFKNTNSRSPTFTNRTSATATPYTNFYYDGNIYTIFGNGSGATPAYTPNTWQITTTYTNSTYTVRDILVNGKALPNMGYSLNTENGSLDTFGRRDWDNPDVFFQGDLAAAIHIRGSLAFSLRKRFEHAMAFSFKFATS